MEMEKKYMNIVVIGHFQSGKSTTAGHMIYKCGGVDTSIIDNYENEAKLKKRGLYKYARVFDRKIDHLHTTMEISTRTFKTPKYNITITDVPGLNWYIHKTVASISQAHCAILILSACADFEKGILLDGQTHQHALLAFTFNVKHLIVAVNKMDCTKPRYSKNRFEQIKNITSSVLAKMGYKPATIAFVPISGRYGENLVERSLKMPWFKGWSINSTQGIVKGMSLIEAIDAVTAPARPINKPLRLLLQNIYDMKDTGAVVTGPVVAGTLTPGMTISIGPKNITTDVYSVQLHYVTVQKALASQTVGLNFKKISAKKLHRGYVVGDPENNPPKAATSFLAEVSIFNDPATTFPDTYCADEYIRIFYHAGSVVCKISEIRLTSNIHTGKVQVNPKAFGRGDCATIRLCPSKPICVERFQDFPSLGRIALCTGDPIIGIGTIINVRFVDGTSSGPDYY